MQESSKVMFILLTAIVTVILGAGPLEFHKIDQTYKTIKQFEADIEALNDQLAKQYGLYEWLRENVSIQQLNMHAFFKASKLLQQVISLRNAIEEMINTMEEKKLVVIDLVAKCGINTEKIVKLRVERQWNSCTNIETCQVSFQTIFSVYFDMLTWHNHLLQLQLKEDSFSPIYQCNSKSYSLKLNLQGIEKILKTIIDDLFHISLLKAKMEISGSENGQTTSDNLQQVEFNNKNAKNVEKNLMESTISFEMEIIEKLSYPEECECISMFYLIASRLRAYLNEYGMFFIQNIKNNFSNLQSRKRKQQTLLKRQGGRIQSN